MDAMPNIMEVKIPDIGDFEEVAVIEVMVKPGDTIKPEDPLITLESDKATMDVPSPAAGKVKDVRLKVGDKIKQGSLILLLETAEAAPAPAAPAKPAPKVVAPAAAPAAPPRAVPAPVTQAQVPEPEMRAAAGFATDLPPPPGQGEEMNAPPASGVDARARGNGRGRDRWFAFACESVSASVCTRTGC